MKKTLLISCLLLGIAETGIAQQTGTIIGDRDKVRVRTKPTTVNSETVGCVNKGDKVMILNKTSKKDKIGSMEAYWYKIKFDDSKEGWVFGHFVKYNDRKIYEKVNYDEITIYQSVIYQDETQRYSRDYRDRGYGIVIDDVVKLYNITNMAEYNPRSNESFTPKFEIIKTIENAFGLKIPIVRELYFSPDLFYFEVKTGPQETAFIHKTKISPRHCVILSPKKDYFVFFNLNRTGISLPYGQGLIVSKSLKKIAELNDLTSATGDWSEDSKFFITTKIFTGENYDLHWNGYIMTGTILIYNVEDNKSYELGSGISPCFTYDGQIVFLKEFNNSGKKINPRLCISDINGSAYKELYVLPYNYDFWGEIIDDFNASGISVSVKLTKNLLDIIEAKTGRRIPNKSFYLKNYLSLQKVFSRINNVFNEEEIKEFRRIAEELLEDGKAQRIYEFTAHEFDKQKVKEKISNKDSPPLPIAIPNTFRFSIDSAGKLVKKIKVN